MDAPAPLSAAARTLGYAGLLPQALALALVVFGRERAGEALATVYASVIVSFLGGIWWGFAMRRRRGQAALAAAAVVPSLAVVAVLWIAWLTRSAPTGLIGLGATALLTLPVDRALERRGEAPVGWFRFRATLSTALAALTFGVGLLAT